MKSIFATLFIMTSMFCVSQNLEKDSIINLMNTTNDQKKKSLLYAQMSRSYKESDIDSAIYYSKKGEKLAVSLNYKLGIAKNSAELGGFYILKNNLDSAKVYYHRAKDFFKQTDSLFNYAENTMRIGNVNLAQNNHTKALEFYLECLNLSNKNNYKLLKPHLYNNIGLIYKDFEDYDDAKANFKKAYDLFIENEDPDNSVYPLYNLSIIQSAIGNDNEAINGYLSLVSHHLKTENWVSLASIYNNISEIYLKDGENDLALQYLTMALDAIEDKKDSFNTGPSTFYQASIFANASEVYYKIGQDKLAKRFAHNAINTSFKNSYKLNIIKSAKILGEIYDDSKQLDSALIYNKIYIEYNEEFKDENDIKQIIKLKMQNDFDKILKKNEIERIYQEASFKNRELKFIGLSVFALLSAIILVLLYFNQKNKNTQLKLKEENLTLERNKLHQDLDYKKKELASNMMYLMEKNEFITSISKKLIELKPDAKKDNKDLIQSIINEIRINSTTKIWEEFEIRFKEVHIDFYDSLNKNHPDLTLNETKICAFLRLNMSTKEISAITHQSIKSINMARFRLRKKLNIDRDENLIAYLNNL